MLFSQCSYLFFRHGHKLKWHQQLAVGNITIDKLCLVVQQKGLTMWIMEDVALGLLPGPSWRREDLWQSPQLNIAQCGQASHGVACRVDTCWICAAACCCTPVELTRWMTESRDRRAFLRRGFEELRLSIASERQSGVYDRTIQNRIAHFETHGQFFALWDSQRLQKIQDQCQSHSPKPVKLPPVFFCSSFIWTKRDTSLFQSDRW